MKGFEELAFEQLQQMYRGQMGEKRAQLAKDWESLRAGTVSEELVLSLRRQLHNLSGSAGAYGYDAMGEMARNLERHWVQWLALPAGKRQPAAQTCGELDGLMRTLQAAMDEVALPPAPGDH
jgi:HPt (histidine-containing phosphotransfer) domain-containing protein